MRVKDLRELFADALELDEIHNGTIELTGVSFTADEPLIFGAVNEDYVRRELEWYLSESLNVNDIPGSVPKIWQQVADNDGFINSNYGYLIYSKENGSQYLNVLAKLGQDPDTRQAVMVYTRPSIHKDWNVNGRHDFICTNAVQYLVRDGKLDAVVQMRSNDAIFGYRNDYAWQKYVLDELAKDLKRVDVDVVPGNIFWQVGSLHIYERHFNLVQNYIETGEFGMSL